MIPFDKGFCPDLPLETPGILSLSQDTIPSEYGMERAPAATSYGMSAMVAAPRGAKTLTKLDGTNRIFAGTASELYEASGSSWTTRSAATYTLGAESRWSFTQFGDTSLASCVDEVIQQSSSGSFAAVSGAPQATIIESVVASGGGFVMAFNTIDGTYGTSPDRWWCSALNDATSSTAWTPSIASQCATGRLLGFEGKITAAKKFGGDKIIAYKENSAYIGQYVGPPGIWSWQEFPGVGCVGPEAVVDIGSAHFVVSGDDIYIFDGVRKTSVAGGIREYYKTNSAKSYRAGTTVLYDRERGLVRVFFAGSTGSTHSLNFCLVYHLRRNIWGENNDTYASPLIVPSLFSNYNQVAAVFNTSHVLQTFDGTPSTSVSITIPEVGDDKFVSSLKQVSLRFRVKPSTSISMGYNTKMSQAGSYTFIGTQSDYDSPGGGLNIFNLRGTGRWHSIGFTIIGDYELTGYDIELVQSGRR